MPRYRTERGLGDPELDVAHAIHQRVTASESLRVPGIAVTGHAQSAGTIGGDWWACEPLPDGRVLVAVGDVTGHDLAAALIAAMARGVLLGAARTMGHMATPARVMATLGEAIAELGPTGRAMTCCVMIFDPRLGRVDVASAGHPFPFLRRARGALDVVVARGAPLSDGRPDVGLTRVAIAPGDLIVISTDGLADRAGQGGRRFGERRLRRLLSEHLLEATTNVHRVRTSILHELDDFAAATTADDDLTIVVCEYRERVMIGGRSAPDDSVIEAAIDAAIDAAVETDLTEPMSTRGSTDRSRIPASTSYRSSRSSRGA